MKRILFFLVLFLSGITFVHAQMRVWVNNEVIFEYDYTKIDSITFALQSTPPAPDITNLPAKVETLMGAEASDVRLYLEKLGYQMIGNDPIPAEAESYEVVFVNSAKDSVECVFSIPGQKLEEVSVLKHFDKDKALDVYKVWSRNAYAVASWMEWSGMLQEDAAEQGQRSTNHDIFTEVLKALNSAYYIGEEFLSEDNNGASIDYSERSSDCLITYSRWKNASQYPPEVYGMGNCFGGWDMGKASNRFAAVGRQLVSPELQADGNLRMYAAVKAEDVHWWQAEFNVFDGKIVCRGEGEDQEIVPAYSGRKVILNFNEGIAVVTLPSDATGRQ